MKSERQGNFIRPLERAVIGDFGSSEPTRSFDCCFDRGVASVAALRRDTCRVSFLLHRIGAIAFIAIICFYSLSGRANCLQEGGGLRGKNRFERGLSSFGDTGFLLIAML